MINQKAKAARQWGSKRGYDVKQIRGPVGSTKWRNAR